MFSRQVCLLKYTVNTIGQCFNFSIHRVSTQQSTYMINNCIKSKSAHFINFSKCLFVFKALRLYQNTLYIKINMYVCIPLYEHILKETCFAFNASSSAQIFARLIGKLLFSFISVINQLWYKCGEVNVLLLEIFFRIYIFITMYVCMYMCRRVIIQA